MSKFVCINSSFIRVTEEIDCRSYQSFADDLKDNLFRFFRSERVRVTAFDALAVHE